MEESIDLSQKHTGYQSSIRQNKLFDSIHDCVCVFMYPNKNYNFLLLVRCSRFRLAYVTTIRAGETTLDFIGYVARCTLRLVFRVMKSAYTSQSFRLSDCFSPCAHFRWRCQVLSQQHMQARKDWEALKCHRSWQKKDENRYLEMFAFWVFRYIVWILKTLNFAPSKPFNKSFMLQRSS